MGRIAVATAGITIMQWVPPLAASPDHWLAAGCSPLRPPLIVLDEEMADPAIQSRMK